MSDAIGLYIHIPFCRHKCFYCDFNSVAGQENRIDEYVDVLILEIESQKKRVVGRKALSIFIGGGTPSLPDVKHIERIVDVCRKNFDFEGEAEITIEMNPESVTTAKLKDYICAGVNRASIGIQSLNDDELKFLERAHTADEARQAVETTINAGFRNISVDMMFALPGQTTKSWLAQLHEITGWGLNHISCYELTPEKGTPLGRLVENGSVTLPDNGVEIFDETERLLEEKGYEHYEVSNYAKPGYECLHNLGYWEYRDFLGFGAGAHSSIGGKRWGNAKSVENYITKISGSGSAIEREEVLSQDMMATERLMLGLRLKEGVLFDKALVSPAMKALEVDGLIQIACGKIKATKRGWRLLDTVLASL